MAKKLVNLEVLEGVGEQIIFVLADSEKHLLTSRSLEFIPGIWLLVIRLQKSNYISTL